MTSEAVRKDMVVPLCEPEIRGNEWRYVRDCLDTNWVSSAGPYVDRFEQGIAEYCGARHGVATVNGTAALHTALMCSGVRPDEEVLVPALTFVAPANAVRYVGAWPVFMDVDPAYGQMDAGKVVDFLRAGCRRAPDGVYNRQTGRRVRAILPVHLLGHPVDMDPLVEVARELGLAIIEDATESLGARYRDRRVGTFGDMACFSFNGNKLITTGGGGMIVTDDGALAGRARYLTTQAKDDPIEYVHEEIGYNYRLTNLQAAMGCAQLELIDEFIEAKRRIAAFYSSALSSVPGLTVMSEAAWATSVFWLSVLRVEEEAFGMDSRELMRILAAQGIQSRPLWQPLHRLRPFADAYAHRVEVADELHRTSLSLPSSVGLAHDTARLHYVVDSIQSSIQLSNR